jgi:hypothetical protein
MSSMRKHTSERRDCRSRHRPILPTNLAGGSGLGSDLSAEGVDFLDNELLHALYRIFLLKSEVEFL